MSNWHKRFLNLARAIAEWSKDPNTKVGAVAVGASKQILETGFNGLPRGVQDLSERMERPAKYIWTAHAEENLVAHAARKQLEGSTVYVTHLCCNACARMLINAGVAKVVVGDGKTSMPLEQFDAATTMFDEAGIELEFSR
jgi:dCMP deaminase